MSGVVMDLSPISQNWMEKNGIDLSKVESELFAAQDELFNRPEKSFVYYIADQDITVFGSVRDPLIIACDILKGDRSVEEYE